MNRLRHLSDFNKISKALISEVPERERKESGSEKVFKERMAEISQNSAKGKTYRFESLNKVHI